MGKSQAHGSQKSAVLAKNRTPCLQEPFLLRRSKTEIEYQGSDGASPSPQEILVSYSSRGLYLCMILFCGKFPVSKLLPLLSNAVEFFLCLFQQGDAAVIGRRTHPPFLPLRRADVSPTSVGPTTYCNHWRCIVGGGLTLDFRHAC